jgi:hypothetical protein
MVNLLTHLMVEWFSFYNMRYSGQSNEESIIIKATKLEY